MRFTARLVCVVAICASVGCNGRSSTSSPSDSPSVTARRSDISVSTQSKPPKAKRLKAQTEFAVQGDLQLSVRGASLGLIALADPRGKESYSDQRYMHIWLKATNTSPSRFVDYPAWGRFSAKSCTLKDDLGNTYRLIDFGNKKPVDRPTDTRIRSSESAEDYLVFDPPVPKAEELYLSLALPDGSTAEFVVPASIVRK